MFEGQGRKKRTVFAHIIQNFIVCILYEQTFKRARFCRKMSCCVHVLRERHTVFFTNAVVLFAVCVGGVDDARTVCEGNIIITGHKIRVRIFLHKGEQRFIMHIFQILPLHAFNDFVVAFAEDGVHQGLSHDDNVAVIIRLSVGFAAVYGQYDIGGQCPGGCRPSEEILIFLALYLKFRDSGGFLYIFVALRDFVGGQRSSTARTIGNDLMPLVEQAFIPDLLQRPPFGFDIFVMVGNIRVVHVCPEANAVAHRAPFLFVRPDAFLTFADKGDNAVALNLLLAIQAKYLFDLQLNGQSMRIPAGFTEDFIALHGFVAGNQVFYGAGDDMPNVGLAVCGRGAIVERENGCAFTGFDALAEDVVVLPILFHLNLALDEVQVRWHFIVHIKFLLKR